MPLDITFKGLLDDQLDIKSKENFIFYSEYISEEKEYICGILKDDSDHLVCASTGGGKTTVFIELGLEPPKHEEFYLVIAVPLVMLANQKYDDYITSSNLIGKIIGSSSDSSGKKIKATSNKEINTFFKRDTKKKVIICVYDSVLRFTELAGDTCKKYILIIDECHQLTSSVNFRTTAINNLLHAKEKFKKTIYITGTPQGTIHINDKSKTHLFQLKPKNRIKQVIHIIYYKKHPLYELYKHILNNTVDGMKTVILLDNRENLLRLQHFIQGTLNKKVVVLTSHDRNSEEAVYIIDNNRISDDTDFLLTTRVISDGIDLKNEDINSVYIVNVDDFLIKRQFLGRFRAKRNRIFELICIDQEESPVINFNKKVSNYTKLLDANEYKGIINPSYKSREKSFLRIRNIKAENRHADLSKYMAANFVMDEIYNENIYPSFPRMTQYYKKFTDYTLEKIDNPTSEGIMSFVEFDTKLNIDFSADPNTHQWYSDNIPKILVYMNREKKFAAFSKFKYARKECYDFNLNLEQFHLENILLLKEEYQVLQGKKKKSLMRETRFAVVYSDIERLIMEGYTLPLVRGLFCYGLRVENHLQFKKLIQLLDTYFLHEIYVRFENFRYLCDVNARLETVRKIHALVELNKDYNKKVLYDEIKKLKCSGFKLYEIDAILDRDISGIIGKDNIRFKGYSSLKSIIESQGIILEEGINLEFVEQKVRMTKLLMLLDQSIKSIRQDSSTSHEHDDLEENILADKYLYEAIFSIEDWSSLE